MTRAAIGMLILTMLSMPGCSGTAGGVDIWKAVEANDAAAIEKYAKAGGDLNIRDWGGSTPLWVALDEKKRESYEALLNNGADPNIVLGGERVVTHWAASAEDDSWWLKLALDHGADPNLESVGKNTPLHFAINDGNVIETKVALDNVKLLIEHGADANKLDQHNCSPLAAAGFSGKYKIVLYLLKNGADSSKSQKRGISFIDHIRRHYANKNEWHIRQETRDDLDAVCTWLEAHGVKIEEEED